VARCSAGWGWLVRPFATSPQERGGCRPGPRSFRNDKETEGRAIKERGVLGWGGHSTQALRGSRVCNAQATINTALTIPAAMPETACGRPDVEPPGWADRGLRRCKGHTPCLQTFSWCRHAVTQRVPRSGPIGNGRGRTPRNVGRAPFHCERLTTQCVAIVRWHAKPWCAVACQRSADILALQTHAV
jgi:hypothetical protein